MHADGEDQQNEQQLTPDFFTLFTLFGRSSIVFKRATNSNYLYHLAPSTVKILMTDPWEHPPPWFGV